MISRILAGALALVFLSIPGNAQDNPEGPAAACISPAHIHMVLDADVARFGGHIITVNGADSQAIASELLTLAEAPPEDGIDFLMVHRVNNVADVWIFANGCARARMMVPLIVFDSIYGAQS